MLAKESFEISLPEMQRYFFRLVDDQSALDDPDGSELLDANAARARALLEARSIMKAQVDEGCLCLGCRIEVDNEEGERVATILFKEALEISGF